MDFDALKIYIDGSALKNPGPGGLAAIIEFPISLDLENKNIFKVGYYKTTNQRMELRACIEALGWIIKNSEKINANRIIIVTDSSYVCDNRKNAPYWRKNKWRNRENRPIMNADLWKRFISVRDRVNVRTEIIWKRGKSTEELKAADKLAKEAAKHPTKTDFGFSVGKVLREPLQGVSNMFFAKGQKLIIKIYRKQPVKRETKISFTNNGQKFYAYVDIKKASKLHRGHSYEVLFNDNPKYPIIIEIIEEKNKD